MTVRPNRTPFLQEREIRALRIGDPTAGTEPFD